MEITSQLTLRLQNKYDLEAGRIYRAVEIVRAGEIQLAPSGNYIARPHSKSSKLTSYQVNLARRTCQCEDAREIIDSQNNIIKTANVCKHQIAALILRELEYHPARTFRNYDELFAAVGLSFEQAKQEAIATGEPRVALVQRDVIAEREQTAKQNRPPHGEWVEELD